MDTAPSATNSSTDEQTSPNPVPQPRTHSSVWNFEPVCFDVENEIFTVIKKDLCVPGSVFVDMFQVPSGDQPAEGKDWNNPIVLQGVKARHFHAFLSVIYPWANGVGLLHEQDEATLLGVLHLANMWHFPTVREQAIYILSDTFVRNKDSPEKIRLGEKYFVQKWALDGYADLVQKRGLKFGELEKEPYSFDDLMIKKILHLQVNYGPGPQHYHGPEPHPWGYDRLAYCSGYQASRSDIDTAVKELLNDELVRALYVTDSHVP